MPITTMALLLLLRNLAKGNEGRVQNAISTMVQCFWQEHLSGRVHFMAPTY